jgi:hypothetical protein
VSALFSIVFEDVEQRQSSKATLPPLPVEQLAGLWAMLMRKFPERGN